MAGPFDLLEKGLGTVGEIVTGGGAKKAAGIGDALSQLPGAFAGGVRTAAQFGPVGDAAGAIGALTGRDPSMGFEMSPWERGLTIAAIGGIGLFATASQTARGQHALAQVHGYRRPSPFKDKSLQVQDILPPAENYMIGVRPVQGQPRTVVTERTPSELAALNQPVPNQDLVFGTMKRFSNDVLSVEPDPNTGWHALARVVTGSDDDVVIEGTRGFIEGLGRRLVSESPHHQRAMAGLDAMQHAEYEHAAAAFTLSQFQAGLELDVLKGKKLGEASKAWQKLRAGKVLDEAEAANLADSMVAYSSALWWVDHPELAMSPLVGIKGLNIDDGGTVIDLGYLQFDPLPLERMTQKEINDRISLMFQTHPTAMVEPMAEVIKRFTRKHLLGDPSLPDAEAAARSSNVQKWAKWYPDARREIDDLSKQVGVNPKALTVAASILSAGEEWETNVAKAGDLAQLIRSTKRGRGAVKRIQRAAQRKGLKVSETDVIRTILAMEIDDPMSFFTRGTTSTTEALTFTQLAKRWEKGESAEVLVDLRKKNQPHHAQKQPSFAYGIGESFDADLEDQARYLAEILTGRHGALSSVKKGEKANVHFSDLRRALPVVVDRQAFKVALGFSLVPDTYLSSQKGVYDAMAQAYRIAAADIGVVPELGRPLLPEELQAITWMQQRENARVVYKGAPKRPDYQLPGYRSDRKGVAGWRTAHGPALIEDDSILQLAQGYVEKLPFSGVDALDIGTDWRRFRVAPESLNMAAKPAKGRSWREVSLRVEPDGTFKFLTPEVRPELTEGAMRGRWATRVKVDGETVWAPVEAVAVDDVGALYERWHRGLTTYSVDDPRIPATTGGSMYMQGAPDLWLRPGHHMWITAPDTVQGYPGKLAHDRLAAELRAQGINFTVEHAPAAHKGLSRPKQYVDAETGQTHYLWAKDSAPDEIGRELSDAEWRALENVPHEEARIGAAFTFDTPDDLARAAAYLERPAEASWAHDAAHTWFEKAGRELGIERPRWVPSGTTADPERGRRMAELYAQAPEFDPAAEPAYRAMVSEVEAQYRFMTEDLGIRVEFVMEDPYPNHAAMVRDVLDNRTLKVFDTRAGIGSKSIKSRDLSGVESMPPISESAPEVAVLRSVLEIPSVLAKAEPLDGTDVVKLYRDGQRIYLTKDEQGVTSFIAISSDGTDDFVDIIWRDPERTVKGAGQKLYRAAYDDGVDIPNARADALTEAGRKARQRFVESISGEIGDDELFGHPFMTVGQNNQFRAVHDFFGHAAQQNSFSRDGEEIAWMLHSQMFSAEARKAMTVETRLQNSYLNFGPNPGTFGDQKVFLPPQEFVDLPADVRLAEQPGTNGWEIYREQVLERIYYTDPSSAPAGTKRVLESRWKDPSGREFVNLNTAGDANRSNTVPVYLPAEYADYVTPARTRSLDPASGGHFVEQRNGKWWLDGQAEIIDPGEGVTLAPAKDVDKLEGALEVKWKKDGKTISAKANVLRIHMPEDGSPPQLSAGVARDGKRVEPAEIPGADPLRTFEVRLGNTTEIRVPVSGTNADGILASQVEDLLVRMGLSSKVRFKSWRVRR